MKKQWRKIELLNDAMHSNKVIRMEYEHGEKLKLADLAAKELKLKEDESFSWTVPRSILERRGWVDSFQTYGYEYQDSLKHFRYVLETHDYAP